jgi:hypothetical protein
MQQIGVFSPVTNLPQENAAATRMSVEQDEMMAMVKTFSLNRNRSRYFLAERIASATAMRRSIPVATNAQTLVTLDWACMR